MLCYAYSSPGLVESLMILSVPCCPGKQMGYGGTILRGQEGLQRLIMTVPLGRHFGGLSSVTTVVPFSKVRSQRNSAAAIELEVIELEGGRDLSPHSSLNTCPCPILPLAIGSSIPGHRSLSKAPRVILSLRG